MKRSKHGLIERLLNEGYTKSAAGSKEFWRAYRAEFDKLPEQRIKDRARAKRKREAAKKAESLTPTQLTVACALLKHKAIKEIAHELNIRPRTVIFHSTAIYKRSKVGSKNQLIALWSIKALPERIQAQLPPPPEQYVSFKEGDALPMGRMA